MSTTPLKDAWNSYKDNLDTSNVVINISNLEIDDYVLLSTSVGSHYAGQVVKIGPKNIIVKMPYGNHPDSDFIQMQQIKFKKSEVVKFYKPKAK